MPKQHQKSGLTRYLLIWFLSIAIIPLIIVSFIGYQDAKNRLYSNTFKNLGSIANIQTELIENHFDRILTDIQLEAERHSNAQFLQTLIESYSNSNQSLQKFVTSFRWVMQTDKLSQDLKTFRKQYGYYDIFLIDNQGNILFSIAQEDDLGTNLFTGPYANTLFASSAKHALTTGKTTFSDLEFYSPSKNKVASFVSNVLLNEDGDKIGLVAFQLTNNFISTVNNRQEGAGKTEQTYLMGTDFKVRTNLPLSKIDDVLKTRVNANEVQQWMASHIQDNEIIDHKAEIISYQNSRQQQVIGVFKPIEIAGVIWVVVAEINSEEAFAGATNLAQLMLILTLITIILIIVIAYPLARKITKPILSLSKSIEHIAQGDLNVNIGTSAKHEIGMLEYGIKTMLSSLQYNNEQTSSQEWLQSGLAGLNEVMRGEQPEDILAREIISYLCSYLNLPLGAFYLNQNKRIKLLGSYAFTQRKGFRNEFALGEGLVGQAALEQHYIVFSQVPDDYVAISSGLGETTPTVVTVYPIQWNEEVLVILELGSQSKLDENIFKLLELIAIPIASAINTAISREQTQHLLVQTQHQADELKEREKLLKDSNNQLEKQTAQLEEKGVALEENNEKLQAQQEELRIANNELEIKTSDLELSEQHLQQQNEELDKARNDLEVKARDLEITSKYKSEFLANMSHELRTPLNSLLILSKMLADNKKGNLDDKQVEFANTIYDSGGDLLTLINDILDLSKIEAGKMELTIENVYIADLITEFDRKFRQLTVKKSIAFEFNLDDDLPKSIQTDGHKLNQILRNLLSNAIKFTSQGGVTVNITKIKDDHLLFSVTDTGTGIPEDKQKIIFEAFQQVDGTTSRKFGGTGLGLSIARELAKLLGGIIQLESVVAKGSTFSLLLPLSYDSKISVQTEQKNTANVTLAPSKETNEKETKNLAELPSRLESKQSQNTPVSPAHFIESDHQIKDDRNELQSGDKSILIIEDDSRFADILSDVAHDRGFKTLQASDGETGVYLADLYQPSGIILDIGLPGIDGWDVIERLKNNAKTRHIPVHFMSANDATDDALKKGAVGFLTKPVNMDSMNDALTRLEHFITSNMKTLLVVEDDALQQESILALLDEDDITVHVAKTGKEALDKIKQQHYDCIVLDLKLPDMDGGELLETIRIDHALHHIPIIVYTGKDLDSKEKALLEKYAQSIIIKDVRSPEQLLDDTSLFLHRIEANLPEEKRRMINMMHNQSSSIVDKKILLVDDDMRNVFALSQILQDEGALIIIAKNGLESLSKLKDNSDIDLILMDIMMPEMDGYEAMLKIRQQKQHKNLPIIALTAKAMKGDRAACIKAGANDYLAKPIDSDKLFSMMKVWLYQ